MLLLMMLAVCVAVAVAAQFGTSTMHSVAGQNTDNQLGSLLQHVAQLDIDQPLMAVRQTSIVCTIGPATKSVEMLGKLVEAGMDILRINLSHGSEEYFREVVSNLRESSAQDRDGTKLRRNMVAIAFDTKGPEIRTGELCCDEDPLLRKGSHVTIHIRDEWKDKCDAEHVFMDYPRMVELLSVGDSVYVDDGLISLSVVSINRELGELRCEVISPGRLGSRKGCNLPGIALGLPPLCESDIKALWVGVELEIDMVFASFISCAEDVRRVRAELIAASRHHTGSSVRGKRIKVISKIESVEGMQHFDEILDETDGVMGEHRDRTAAPISYNECSLLLLRCCC